MEITTESIKQDEIKLNNELLQRYKNAYEKQKNYCKKYHQSDKGKERRREAQKKYYARKKAEKLKEKELQKQNEIDSKL